MDSTIHKLIVLYVFDAMGMPLNEDSVVDICYYEIACMQFIDCKEALFNLLDAGLLCVASNATSKPLYTITSDGSECLTHFYMRIPSHLREQITTFGKENRLRLRKQQEYFSDYYKNEDGSHTVLLRIINQNIIMMELKLVVSSRANAKWITKNWCDKAAQVYSVLHETLLDN
ncbi:MAG: DUF4364 family protein [Clostridia bacterium]